MTRSTASARDGARAARSEAVRAIAGRLAAQREQLAARIVERSREEIVEYRLPSDPHLLADGFNAALEHIDALVMSLRSGEPVIDEQLESTRESAARRLHQGVPLESVLRATRLWAMVCWSAVLAFARPEVPQEREAALDIAGLVMDLADRVSTTATRAYLDEITDRGLLRRDLLDAMLSGKGGGNYAVQLARRLRVRLEANYVVVVVRGEGIEAEEAREQLPAARSCLDRLVEETRRAVRPSAGALLAGKRNADLVVLYPATSAADLDAVRQDCRRLAEALGAEVSIGMSGWHEGREAVALAYAEAEDAVAIAARLGIKGRALGLDEVLVDHMLASSAPARRILKDVLRPLVSYDEARQAALVPTLRAYLFARCNVTKAAQALYVNPNTVVYRLQRIKELSGRDTHDIDDLFVLYAALKLEAWRS